MGADLEVGIDERRRLNQLVAERVGFRTEKWGEYDHRLVNPRGEGVGNLCARAEMCHLLYDPDFARSMDAWLEWGLPWMSKPEQHIWWEIASLATPDGAEVAIEHDGRWLQMEGPLATLPLLLSRLVEKLSGEA